MKRLLLTSLAAIAIAASGAFAQQSTLDVVKKSGELVVGLGMECSPFSYRDAGGNLVGFEVDLTNVLVKNLEAYVGVPLKLRLENVTDETRISWVQSGQISVSVCHCNNTRKRQDLIDFSVPYFWDGKSVMYNNAKGKKDLKDFAGKTIGFKRSSSSEGEIKRYFEAQGWTAPVLKQFDNHTAGIKALADGQIDGFTDDNSIIISTAMLAGYTVGEGKKLNLTPGRYSAAYYGVGVKENDSKWRKAIDFALHDMWLSGDYQKIYDKWFGAKSKCPIPLGTNKMEPFVKG